jgi:hypothetical protein
LTHKLRHRNEDLSDNRVENLFYREHTPYKETRNPAFISELPNPWEGE